MNIGLKQPGIHLKHKRKMRLKVAEKKMSEITIF